MDHVSISARPVLVLSRYAVAQRSDGSGLVGAHRNALAQIFVMPVVRVLWMLLVLVGAQVVIEGSQR